MSEAKLFSAVTVKCDRFTQSNSLKPVVCPSVCSVVHLSARITFVPKEPFSPTQELERTYYYVNNITFPTECEGPASKANSSLASRQLMVKVYIHHSLWERREQDLEPGANVTKSVLKQVETLLSKTSKHLQKLDDGGFVISFDKTVHRLENSDVKIRQTYIDRTDGNLNKTYEENHMYSHTFTFQEAVQEMPKQQRQVSHIT